jgi:hypothetical protein
MFSRTAILHTTRATVIALLFVVVWPVMGYASGLFAAPSVMHEICTMEGMKSALQDGPGVPGSDAVVQKPCVFCYSSVPVFADAHTPRLVAFAQDAALLVVAPPELVLPPDVAATQPLSPRAPPRLI